MKLKVPKLLEFFSADENSMALLMDQGTASADWASHRPQAQWFQATSGLITIRALVEFLDASTAALGSETESVLIQVREYDRVLRKTEQHGLRWHVAVSRR
jgi:hypothetical protein